MQTLALMPFVLKFLAGPFSDRFNLFGLGHRKPYIVLGLVLQSLGLMGLALVDPGRQLVGFTALAVLTVTGLGLYDTCCDGMVIDATPPDDRGRVQGMLVAARALAAMVCSYGFGLWVDGGSPGATERYPACSGPARRWAGPAGSGRLPARAGPRRRRRAVPVVGPEGPGAATVAGLLAFGAALRGRRLRGRDQPEPLLPDPGASRQGQIGGLRLAPLRGPGGRRAAPAGPPAGWAGARCCRSGSSRWRPRPPPRRPSPVPSRPDLGALAFGAANGWTDALFYILAMEAADPRMAASTYALFMAVTNVSVVGGWIFAEVATALGHGFTPRLRRLGPVHTDRLAADPAPEPSRVRAGTGARRCPGVTGSSAWPLSRWRWPRSSLCCPGSSSP